MTYRRPILGRASHSLIAVVLHLASALVANSLAGIEPLTANFCGLLVAMLFRYFGHARPWAEKNLCPDDQALKFAIIGLVALATSSSLVWILTVVFEQHFALAMLLVGLTMPVSNFLALKFWASVSQPNAQKPLLVGAILALVISISVLILVWDRQINHDTAWYLFSTREWLNGAALYVDIIEVNPPLNFYFTVPAIWLADILPIGEKNSQYVIICALIFAILTWSNAIVFSSFQIGQKKTVIFIMMLAAAMILPAIPDFAQREQIFVLLAAPWLLGQASAKPPIRGQDLAQSLFAALGMCLKPYFALVPIAIIVLRMWRQKSVSPAFALGNFAFLAVGIAYIAL